MALLMVLSCNELIPNQKCYRGLESSELLAAPLSMHLPKPVELISCQMAIQNLNSLLKRSVEKGWVVKKCDISTDL